MQHRACAWQPERIGRAGRVCKVCGAPTKVFWAMAGLPVLCNVLCENRAQALAMPRGDISLGVCARCGFVQNDEFDSAIVEYDAAYENSLAVSAVFQSYANTLAQRLIDTYDLHGKRIVEIACGNGYFLTLLCSMGCNDGVGFDPSLPAEVERRPAGGGSVRLVSDFYDERHAKIDADFVCCRHALEHMEDPVAFLRVVRSSIGGSPEAVVFFEVPNVLYTVREMGIWDIIYEHCCYFCKSSLTRCFQEAGFAVNHVDEVYDGQFLVVEARVREIGGDGRATDSEVATLCRGFAGRFVRKLGQWEELLRRYADSGTKVALWGAGSKGVTFVNMLPDSTAVACVVDSNPRKQGRFIAGTAVPIVSPQELQKSDIDAVIVVNPLYRDEIEQTLAELNLDLRLELA